MLYMLINRESFDILTTPAYRMHHYLPITCFLSDKKHVAILLNMSIIYVRVCVWMYVSMYVCMYVCTYICMYATGLDKNRHQDKLKISKSPSIDLQMIVLYFVILLKTYRKE